MDGRRANGASTLMMNGRHVRSTRMPVRRLLLPLLAAAVLPASFARAADASPEKRLQGLDAYMETIVKDWNVPGIGVGVVVKDRLVFSRGYGFRDYGKKLPFTPKTTVPIASNTKLFTAVAAGQIGRAHV